MRYNSVGKLCKTVENMNLFDDIYNKRAKKKAEDEFAAALDALGYPYRLLEGSIDERGILELYASELEKGGQEGYFPVLAPYERILFELIERSRAEGIDASDLPSGGFSALESFSLLFTEFTKSFRMCALIMLNAAKPWETALLLPFGGRGDCPAPREMAAMLKKWHDSFGAVPAVLSSEALEIYLPRPLTERALRVAAGEIAAFSGLGYDGSDEALSRFIEETRNKCVWHFSWERSNRSFL
jgi:hypothetical protein